MFCQACGARNNVGSECCRRCGCKLMIMSGGVDADLELSDELLVQAQEELEENILERLTSLEETVRALAKSVAGSGRNIAQLEQNLTVAHAGVQALGDLLERQGIVTRTEVVEGWEQTAEQELLTRDLASRFQGCADRIVAQAAHSGLATPQLQSKLRALELALLGPDTGSVNDLLADLAQLVPASDELWSFIGEAAFQTGELETARVAFRRVLELRGPHFETLVYLGAAASDLGRLGEAETALQAARDMAPGSFLPHFTLGALEVLRGRFQIAIEHLEQSLDLQETAQARHLQGIACLEIGRSGRAITALQRAVELAPEFDDALYDLGVAFLRRGWTVKARDAFDRVLRLDPQRLRYQAAAPILQRHDRSGLSGSVSQLVRRAERALQRGQLEHALELLSETLDRAPHEPVLRATASLVACAAGQSRQAVAHAHTLLRQRPPESPCTAAAVVALLESLRQAGRTRAARRIARQLYEDEAFEPLAHAMAAYELAVIESELGDDLDAARELAREALETTPKELRHHPLATLGTIALRRGRHEEAVQYLEQASRAGLRPQRVRRLLASQSATIDPGPGHVDSQGAGGTPEPGIDQEMLEQLRRVAGLLTDLDQGGRSARTTPRS